MDLHNKNINIENEIHPDKETMSKLKSIVNNDISRIPQNFKEDYYIDSNKSIWKTFCIGIVTCDAHEARLNNCMKIYKEIFDKYKIKYYLIKSDPEIETDNDYLIDGDIFYAKAEESYEKLLHKIMIFYSYIEKETDYKYVIKMDDGCLLNLNNMINDLYLDYIGIKRVAYVNKSHWGKCKDPNLNKYVSDFKHEFDKLVGSDIFNKLNLSKAPYAGGGNAYRLSRKSLTGISKYKNHALSLNFSYEDLFIGQVMKLKGIRFTNKIIGRYHFISHD
jgi:hypothetical protein